MEATPRLLLRGGAAEDVRDGALGSHATPLEGRVSPLYSGEESLHILCTRAELRTSPSRPKARSVAPFRFGSRKGEAYSLTRRVGRLAALATAAFGAEWLGEREGAALRLVSRLAAAEAPPGVETVSAPDDRPLIENSGRCLRMVETVSGFGRSHSVLKSHGPLLHRWNSPQSFIAPETTEF